MKLGGLFENLDGPGDESARAAITHAAPRQNVQERVTARLEAPGESRPLELSPDESGWREVPQARFLSWSRGMQLAYCAERDRDAAEHAETLDEAFWFIARAEGYEEAAHGEAATSV